MQGPARRSLLADLILHGDLSADDDHALADLTLECFDFAALIAPSMHVTLLASERLCINDAARNDLELRDALAAEIRGDKTVTDALAGFGVRIVRCLTPAHIAELHARDQTSVA